jgi:hypothetical protein
VAKLQPIANKNEASMTELSGYVLETLREGGEFTLYRGWQHGNPLPVLVLTPVAEQPTPASLRTSRHLYLQSSRSYSRRLLRSAIRPRPALRVIFDAALLNGN